MTGTDLEAAVSFLKKGELVAIPTETVYGLAGNAFNEDSVLKIYKVKNRPRFNPLILHSDSIEKFISWGLNPSEKMMLLVEKFTPGPITFVLPKSAMIPDIVTAGTDAVAIRIPDHPLTLEILRRIDFPLAAPSANPSGYVSPTKALHVEEQLGDSISYILDGGACKVGVESTIISFINDVPEILRFGGLSLERIQDIIGDVQSVFSHLNTGIIAPGMLNRHYATRHELIICDVEKEIKLHDPIKTGVIAFHQVFNGVPEQNQFILSSEKNLDVAACNLFSALRELDKKNIDVILSEIFPDEGLGRAINDRLLRAGAK